MPNWGISKIGCLRLRQKADLSKANMEELEQDYKQKQEEEKKQKRKILNMKLSWEKLLILLERLQNTKIN